MRLMEVSVLYDPKTGVAAQALHLPICKPIIIQSRGLRKTFVDKSGSDTRHIKSITISDKHVLPIIFLIFHRPLTKAFQAVTNKEFINDIKGRGEDLTETVASGVDRFIRNPPFATVALVKATISTTFKAITRTPGLVKRLVKGFMPKPKPQAYISAVPLGGAKTVPKQPKTVPAARQQAASSTAPPPSANPTAAQSQIPPAMLQQLQAMGFYPPGTARPAASAPASAPTPAATPTPTPARSTPPTAPEAPKPASKAVGPAKGLGAGLGGGLPGRNKVAAEEKLPAAGLGAALPSRAKAAAPAPAPVVAATTVEELNDDEDDEWEEADEDDMEDM